MRRVLLLLCVLVLLTSCEEAKDLMGLLITAPDAETALTAYVTPTPETAFPPEMSTAARILARGEIIVGVRYDLEPFSYITTNSELAGLEIDLARELAQRWLDDPNAIRFRQVRSDSAFQHLANGTVDIVLAGVAHTQEMEAQADFSPTYFVNGLAFLTFPDTGIQDVTSLAGRTIGVVSGSGNVATIDATVPATKTYVTYGNFFEAAEALRTRKIDVYGDMRHRLERARRTIAGSTIVAQTTRVPVALVYRQDDPFFFNLVTLTFQDMAADGTLDGLYARWLPGTSPSKITPLPGSAPTPALAESPQQLSKLDVIARIRGRGTLALGYFVDRWPYCADRNDGVPTGFEVRLLERMVERWMGTRQAITFVPVTEANALQMLSQGEIDMLAGNWSPTRGMELRFDTSIEILDDGVSIFSLASAAHDDFSTLNGQAVGVIIGSDGERVLPDLVRAANANVSTVRFPDMTAAVSGLQQGQIAAIVSERRALLQVHFTQPGFYITDHRYTYRPVVYLLPQGDSDYRDLVDLTLAALQGDGTYQELYGLWFDDAIPTLEVWPGNPAVPLVVPAVQ